MVELLSLVFIGLIAVLYIIWYYRSQKSVMKDDELTTIEKMMADRISKRK